MNSDASCNAYGGLKRVWPKNAITNLKRKNEAETRSISETSADALVRALLLLVFPAITFQACEPASMQVQQAYQLCMLRL